jgi:LysR family transcriptional regulator, hca operon transcriptional activator
MRFVELRHLRYFIAVAEEGSLKLAAERRLRTAQPSLSRQMRDLETELGFPLMTRSVRGIQLTGAGKIFLEHARAAIAQVEAGILAARLAAQPPRPVFSVGFLVGHELDCLPPAAAILHEMLPGMELRVFSNFSTTLAADLVQGTLDVAFLRRELDPQLEFQTVMREKLVAILPRNHRLASRKTIDARELEQEVFIGISRVPQVLRGVVNDYLNRSGADIVPRFEIDNFPMAISLVESSSGIAIMPASIEAFLPKSVVSRRLRGEQPSIDLMIGYRKGNESPILKAFLSKLSQLIADIQTSRR